MTLAIHFSKTPAKNADFAVLLVAEGKKTGPEAQKLDKIYKGYIGESLKKSPNFSGKNGETLTLSLPGKGPFAHVLLAGIGKAGDLTPALAEKAGGRIFPALEKAGTKHAALFVDTGPKPDLLAAHMAFGLKMRSYKFHKYKSAKQPRDKFSSVTVMSPKAAAIFKDLDASCVGVFLARNLVNEPPNHVIPELFAKRIVEELKPLGVEIDVLDEKKMEKLGMGAILAVGMGSENLPRMVVMRWNGAKDKKEKPVAFVGKGVTFDTGGISMKPAAGMEEMKMDMAGAAAVVGAMKALAGRKAKANVVGIVGLAENMVSGRATRPSDIITSLSGKTIEVLNTDAEGRLVLADVLTYVQQKYKPHTIVDLATLTGAMMVALGYEYCGTFSNDDGLWTGLEAAGRVCGEKLWRMPLDEAFKKDMESPMADLQNLSKSGRFAGACTAAAFLECFVDKGTKWAHMDIAGTAWIKADRSTVPRYGTGFGVRTLERLVASKFEK